MNGLSAEFLASQIKQSLNLNAEVEKPEQLLEEVTINGIVQYMKSGKCKNIITMTGAGISTCESVNCIK